MVKKSRIAFLLVALAMLSVLVAACGGENTTTGGGTPTTTAAAGPNCQNGSITFDGSTALYPLANAVANSYQDACSGATITAKQSGSGTGLSEAAAGTVDIGNSDIFADPAKYAGLTDHQVAVVVFSVVLNGKVTGVSNLSSKQLIDIYAGKTTNWKDVGGPDLGIVTVSRSPGSGTRATFDQYILNGGNANGPNIEAPGSGNLVAAQSSDLAASVKGTGGAIGYVATFYAKQNGLRTIKLDGVSDDDANVKNNSYKLWNIEHCYTKGTATGLTKAFIDYLGGNSAEVKSARQANGFLPISDLSSTAKDAKQVKFQSSTPTPAPTPTPTA
jgi:phosphate transport system substrate-binding protein